MKATLRVLGLYSLLFLLTSCQQCAIKKGDIFISDILSVYKVDPVSGQKERVLEGKIADISFNKLTHTLFSVNTGDKGYFEIGEKGNSECSTGLAAPNYLYSYKNYILSDSWVIHQDSHGETMGQFGIYDTHRSKLIKTFKEYGTFEGITGFNQFAYVTMFGSEKNNSNVYEVNLDTLTMRPLFKTPQRRAPKILQDLQRNHYAFYKHWDFEPANEIAKISTSTGDRETIAKLDFYAYNATLLKNIAVVIHYDELNALTELKNCITIVDLKTGTQTKMSIPNIRPTNITTYDEKTVAVTDERGYLLLINPFEKKIVKKHFISEGIYFLSVAT